jgi:hypothetical protein
VAHLAVTEKYYKEKKKVGVGCSLLRSEGFSCSLDISKLQLFTKKNFKKALYREIYHKSPAGYSKTFSKYG